VSVPEERQPSIAVHEAWLPEQHPLHRPRHGGRQRAALIAALVFFLAPALALGAGVRPAEFENRPLADAPSFADGWGFFTGLPAWAADHLPFRDAAVHSSGRISRDLFGEPARLDDKKPAPGPMLTPPATGDATPPATGYPTVIEGDEGWLYFGSDVQDKCAPVRPLDEVIGRVQRLRAAVESSGRRFLLVVAPDKSTAVPGYLPDSFAGQQCARTGSARFWHRITTGAGAIDLRPPLGTLARTGMPIYHKLDTHWTDIGSLTMVRALADRIAPEASRTWRAEPEQLREVQADLPRLVGRTGTGQARVYSLLPDGRQDRTGPYVAAMDTPVRFASPPDIGMVPTPVAMRTDSFSLPASRYLAATFSDLTAVFYETAGTDLNTVAEVLAGGEVVVLEVVERNLASGTPAVLDDAVIDRIAEVLRARPVS
jgi:alginate O-acetyltransferase complex protein AlgJ